MNQTWNSVSRAPQVDVLDDTLLSDNWYVLRKLRFALTHADGRRQLYEREVYDRGNGATILLYNRRQRTVVLTRQFRMPAWVNGCEDGMLIEACAGLLDNDAPELAIRREVSEETGFRLGPVHKVFQAYMSPGSVTEVLHFFVAEYEPEHQVDAGGGVCGEEEIDVLELDFDVALAAVADGRICDGKTILLLQYAALQQLL